MVASVGEGDFVPQYARYTARQPRPQQKARVAFAFYAYDIPGTQALTSANAGRRMVT